MGSLLHRCHKPGDLVYGIRDQHILGDQGSGFDIIYGIRDQHILGIRILALVLGSEPHKIFGDKGSKLNKNLESGIKFLAKKRSQVKNILCHNPA